MKSIGLSLIRCKRISPTTERIHTTARLFPIKLSRKLQSLSYSTAALKQDLLPFLYFPQDLLPFPSKCLLRLASLLTDSLCCLNDVSIVTRSTKENSTQQTVKIIKQCTIF